MLKTRKIFLFLDSSRWHPNLIVTTIVNTWHCMFDMKLSLSLMKGCVTGNSNVPLIRTIQRGFSNCTGLYPGLDSWDSNLTFQKMHFLFLILRNFRGRFGSVCIKCHVHQRTLTDWWLTLGAIFILRKEIGVGGWSRKWQVSLTLVYVVKVSL